VAARTQWGGLAVLASMVLAAVLIGLAVWDPGGARSRGGSPLLVHCAAGIKAPVEAIARAYEQEGGALVQFSLGGSQTLLAGLEVAPRGDLFIPADDSFVALARQKGLVAETIPLATMRAVIAVPKGNPKGICSFDDLLRPGIRLGQANPGAAAIGTLTRDALLKTGAWEALRRQTMVFKPTVTDVANDVKLGSVDAGIIWDVLVVQDPALKAVPTPELAAVKAEVTVAVLRCSAQPAAALRFARFLAARDKGLKEFAALGFQTVEGDKWEKMPELVFYSGAMNRGAIEETIKHFEQREGARVTRVYNGCGILVAQMKAGGRPDAYLTCDASFLPPVADLFSGPPVEVSDSRIVILVSKGNPKNIRGLQDLTQPGLRLGVANPEQSTLGALTRKLLERQALLAAVMTNVVTQTPTADMLVNQMTTGALDAVVVYVSNTALVADQLDLVSLPMREALAVQTFSVARDSRHRQLAGRLLEALRSNASRGRYEALSFHWRGDGTNAP
jgi:molybdate transport system substrate-binding protein